MNLNLDFFHCIFWYSCNKQTHLWYSSAQTHKFYSYNCYSDLSHALGNNKDNWCTLLMRAGFRTRCLPVFWWLGDRTWRRNWCGVLALFWWQLKQQRTPYPWIQWHSTAALRLMQHLDTIRIWKMFAGFQSIRWGGEAELTYISSTDVFTLYHVSKKIIRFSSIVMIISKPQRWNLQTSQHE